MADTCGMTGYQVVTDQQRATRLQQAWHLPLVTSSLLLAGGLLFALSKNALLALDPQSGKQLWSSAQPSASDALGGIHWESPHYRWRGSLCERREWRSARLRPALT
jgi:hypothetical protein